MKICTTAQKIYAEKNYYVVETNCVNFRIYFLTDSIIRLRAGFSRNGQFLEASYSLMTTAWDDNLDSFFAGKRNRIECTPSTILQDDDEKAVIASSTLKVEIQKEPFVIRIYDKAGNLLHSDIPDLAYQQDSNKRLIHTSQINAGDYFYGFGEKTGELNKAEQFMSMSPKDAMGYNPSKTDSLYKHIPFYIRLNCETGIATGYFYHNTSECDFDMGREHSNYWKKHSRARFDSGDIDLFFIAGPKITDVTKGYTLLTGHAAMLPKSALGYLGSSMYYSELSKNCDKEIISFVDKAIEEEIPIDGFQLSSGYTAQNTKEGEKRCVFTWNTERFCDPKDFFAQMKKRGITVSPNVKPGILLSHPDIEKFTKLCMFVKASDTEKPAVGTWWGGKGVFVDFTDENAREQWKKLLTKNVLDYGTDSVWNDNCEYDSLVDKDARVNFEGNGGTIGELKSVMSNLMCHVTAQAISEKNKNVRPFIVCRSGHSGIQTVAQTWAGDNRTGWDTLKYNMATILGMALCGVSNYGCDIGGFYGPSPSGELLVRWVQNGIFQSRFSIHSVNTDNTVTEPWMFSNLTQYIRSAIEFRYSLFPYMYSLMERANKTGLSILQPLCSVFQDDKNVLNTFTEFMMGDSLYVATVFEENAKTRKFYLPRGMWYDFYTHKEYVGGQCYEIDVDISSIPLFVREGAIIPLAQNKIMNLATQDVTDLHILCECSCDNDFYLYEDDGVSNAYLDGEYCKTQISLKKGVKTEILFDPMGNYKTKVQNILLDVIHREKSPFYVCVDGVEIAKFINRKAWEKAAEGWYYSQSLKSVLIKYKNPAKKYSVEISFEPFDMLGM